MIKTIAMILSISGNIFVNRKDILGLYIWLVGSFLWVCISFYSKEWQQFIMFLVYFLLNIEGIIRWRKGDGVK